MVDLRLLRLLSNKSVLDVLAQISLKESRFKELSVISNERMRSIRLAELEEFKLIERVGRKLNGKIISFYKITENGKMVLKAVEPLK
ncbi:MAG: hypothetical protein WC492_01955 [Candidatus Micrarchaeia archaeon]